MAIESASRTESGGHLAYEDLRDWIRQIDAMGLMRYVNGANVERTSARQPTFCITRRARRPSCSTIFLATIRATE